jgi:hypothetical protein
VGREGRVERGRGVPKFGVDLNDREPLIAPGCNLADLRDLGDRVETTGFDSA